MNYKRFPIPRSGGRKISGRPRLSSQALYEHRPAACGIQFLANRRGPLLRLCNWLDSSDNNSNSNKRRVHTSLPRSVYTGSVGRDFWKKLPGRERKEEGGTGMADSYAALLLGVGSPALAESGRCVEDCFPYLFVALIRSFIRPCWEGLRLLYGEERVCGEVRRSLKKQHPLPVILNREDGGGFPSHVGDYPVCLFESSIIPH